MTSVGLDSDVVGGLSGHVTAVQERDDWLVEELLSQQIVGRHSITDLEPVHRPPLTCVQPHSGVSRETTARSGRHRRVYRTTTDFAVHTQSLTASKQCDYTNSTVLNIQLEGAQRVHMSAK